MKSKKFPPALKPSKKNMTVSHRLVEKALKGIEKIEPHIHRVKLRLKEGEKSTVERLFGINNFHLMNETERSKSPNYRAVGYGNFKNAQYTIYTERMMTFLPEFMLSVVGPTQKNLYYLSRKLSNIEISSVEYAVDIYCVNHRNVSALFYILRRYMYFPYRDKSSCIGGNFRGAYSDRLENCVWNVWNRAKGQKCITIYERGSDEKKDGAGWNIKDVDRVRIEYLAKNKSKEFSKYNIKSLSEFAKHAYFQKIMSNKFSFKQFKPNSSLPKDWEDFNTTDASNNLECFQEEYLAAKRKYKNVSQYITPAQNLEKFHKDILYEMEKFDSKWAKRYDKNTSQ